MPVSELAPRPPPVLVLYADLAELDDDQPQPVYGQYPRGLIKRLLPWLRCERHQILHVCSGALPRGEGIRVDIREDARPVSATWKMPPKLVFIENVPRIASRGRDIVRQAKALLEAHGYAVTIGTHDCGELGGLAQHRRRWFLLARHREQVPQFVYEPPKRRVRACGEVIGPMPLPGDVDAGGPMHSVPRLSWRNWLRLALIPAAGDWRDLPGVLEDGEQRREKFRRAPVTAWDATAETVTGPGGSAAANVADPRFGNVDRVAGWDEPVGTITHAPAPSSGAAAIADPRAPQWFPNVYRVGEWDQPAGTVTGSGKPSSGQFAVADPRLACAPRAGAYGVLSFDDPSATVTAALAIDNGRAAVADEPDRVANQRENEKLGYGCTGVEMPLAAVGVVKADVLNFWREMPFDLGLRDGDGNCDLCFLLPTSTRIERERQWPGSTRWWSELETRRDMPFRRKTPSYAAIGHAASRLHLPVVASNDGLGECFCDGAA